MAKFRPYDPLAPVDYCTVAMLHFYPGEFHPIYDVHVFGYSAWAEGPPGDTLISIHPTLALAAIAARDIFASHLVADVCCIYCRSYDYGPAYLRWNEYRGEDRARRIPPSEPPPNRYPIPYYAGRIVHWPDWPPIWP